MSISIEKIIEAESTDCNNSLNGVIVTVGNCVSVAEVFFVWSPNTLKERLIIDNPKYLENERRGFSNWDTQKKLSFLHTEGDSLILPRGFVYQLIECLKRYNVSYRVVDKMTKLSECQFEFKGELYPYQQEAVKAVKKKRFGVLTSPTGSEARQP